jgi:acyl-CoA dehydrogenase
MAPTATRERLANGIYKTVEPTNQLGLLQEALEIAEQIRPLERRVFDARRGGEIAAEDTPGQIDEAERKGIITAAEAANIRAFDRRVLDLTGVDDFSPSDLPRQPQSPELA